MRFLRAFFWVKYHVENRPEQPNYGGSSFALSAWLFYINIRCHWREVSRLPGRIGANPRCATSTGVTFAWRPVGYDAAIYTGSIYRKSWSSTPVQVRKFTFSQ